MKPTRFVVDRKLSRPPLGLLECWVFDAKTERRGRLRRTAPIFTTEISDGTATLRGADAHHLARVMRAKLGDTVILCDGNAVEYTATITGFGDECVEFRVEPGYPSAAEPGVEVTLLAGYPKQDKLEQIIKHGWSWAQPTSSPSSAGTAWRPPKKRSRRTSAQPHCSGSRQAVRPGRSAGCGPAAAELRGRVPHL